jgi:arginase
LAVKIVRQPKNIVLLGAPTSAAALTAGHEKAPAALRAAGLVSRLTAAGFTVVDHGDCATRISQPDNEHPRAKNVAEVLATLEELRPRVEIAVKTGALPLILGGDSSIVLAVIAGARRYYRSVGLVYMDRDAELSAPATTSTGCVDSMVMSHVIGRGAPELVRFWGEPPLVREPQVALFGVERLSEPEEQIVRRSTLRHYLAEDVARKGAAAVAAQALDGVHGRTGEFVAHLDLNAIAAEDFRAANRSAAGGLRLGEVRQALSVFAQQPTLAALVVSAYNPDLDPDGTAGKRVIDLLVEVLSPRLECQEQPAAAASEAEVSGTAQETESTGS